MNNMEIIIVVSVLSTLGAVALLISIVVAFIKLKNKVDVNNLERMVEDIHQQINDNSEYTDDRFDRLIDQVYQSLREYDNSYQQEFSNLSRLIDSRCDKLDSKIKSLDKGLMPKSSKKQLNN